MIDQELFDRAVREAGIPAQEVAGFSAWLGWTAQNGSLDDAQQLNQQVVGCYHGGKYALGCVLGAVVVSIRQRLLPPDSPDVAESLNNLASQFEATGRYAEAEPLYRKVVEILTAALGEAHPDVARSLNNLAVLLEATGRYAEAEPLFRKALAVRQAALGEAHPDVAGSLNNLAALLEATKQYVEALLLVRQGMEIRHRQIQQVGAILTAEERRGFAQQSQGEFYFACTVVARHFPNDPDAVGWLFQTVLRRKASEVMHGAELREALATDPRHADDAPKFQRQMVLARAIKERLERSNDDPAGLAALQAEATGLDRELNALFPQLERPDLTRQAVALSLPENGTLLEFVFYRPTTHDPRNCLGDPEYLAFVLTHEDRLALVSLGPAAPLDALVQTFQSAIDGAAGAAEASLMGGGGGPASKPRLEDLWPAVEASLTGLNDMLSPVLAASGESGPLFVAPDGMLAFVPFDQLPFLNASPRRSRPITYLVSGREARHLKTPPRATGENLIVADPDYRHGVANARPLPPDQVNTMMSGVQFGRSPMTAVTGERLRNLLGGALLTDTACTTLAVQNHADRPRFAIFNVHGYVIGQEEAAELFVNRLSVGAGTQSLFQSFSDPLELCGLALTGARALTEGKQLPAHLGKGVATAHDLTLQNFWGTVGLFGACNIARGFHDVGRGVMGFRAALFQSGMRSAVLTLWPVEEFASVIVLEKFCAYALAGARLDDALRQAQDYLQTVTLADLCENWFTPDVFQSLLSRRDATTENNEKRQLDDRLYRIHRWQEDPNRTRTPFAHPIFWAAFVLQGSPAPMA